MPNSIQNIATGHLCTQCGTCVAVCPVHAIEMRETPAGMLLPYVHEAECIACGKCRHICPGHEIDLDIPEKVDPFRGAVCVACVAHACDEMIRLRGQSGGVVTALLLFLLDTGRIDAALVATMPADRSLRPRSILARTRQEIMAAEGSKYCPIASNAILADIPVGDRIAAVGVSCQMHGLHRLAQTASPLVKGIQCRIGLFCDRTLLYTCIDKMTQDAGLHIEEIAGLEYRSKARNGWPGEVCFHLTSGEARFFPSSLRTRLKDSFTPPRCRICFDKMNVFSDIAVGDAWGIAESAKGESVVIARNEKATSLLNEAKDRGYVNLREIDAELVFRKQGIERRRRDFVAFTTVWREIGRSVPEYRGLQSHFPASVDFTTRTACKRELLFNCRIAGVTTREHAIAVVRRRLFLSRLQSLAAGAIRRVRGR